MKTKTLFETPISYTHAYKLPKLGEKKQIPIISDTMFDTMFNNESRIKYVSYFLSLILDMPYDKIINKIHLLKNKVSKEKYNESRKTVDFLCEIDCKYYNIEINNSVNISTLERNLSYACDIYKSKMKTGSKYNYVYTIQININNFTFEGKEEIIEEFRFTNKKGEILTDKLTLYYIYLPNIRIKYYNEGEEKLSELEKMFLILNAENDNLKELLGGNRIMEDYVKDAIDASNDDEVIGLYDRELHLQMLRNTEIYEAGIAGEKRGILTVAKNLLKNNASQNIIMEATGLSKEEIESLK